MARYCGQNGGGERGETPEETIDMNSPYQAPKTDLAPIESEITSEDEQWLIAPLWRRVVAFFINRTPCVLLLGVNWYERYLWRQYGASPSVELEQLTTTIRSVLYIGLAILVLLQMWLMTKDGQSIGKRLLGLRVVDISGEPARFNQVVLRRYCAPLVILLTIQYSVGVMTNMVEYIQIFWYFLLCLGLLLSDNPMRRTWQDAIASTMVVYIKPHKPE